MFLKKLLWFLMPTWALWMADGDPAAGGGDPPATDPNAGIQGMIAKHKNDLMAVITELFTDNYKIRDKNREMRERLKLAEEQKPKEGSVVLDAARVALLEQYEALGPVDELAKTKTDLGALQTELKTIKAERLWAQAAEAHGYKPSVLQRLAGDLAIEMREIEKDGKKLPAAFVLGADGQAVSLEQYASQNWADFIPALKKAEDSAGGTTFVAQNPGDRATPPNMVGNFIERSQKARNDRPNPLVKQAG